MTPDPDAAPASTEPPVPPENLTERDKLAIGAAVAGVAGLLVGRVMLGRAGGLVAGLAAAGAGLLAKKLLPEKKKEGEESAEVVPEGEAPGEVSPAVTGGENFSAAAVITAAESRLEATTEPEPLPDIPEWAKLSIKPETDQPPAGAILPVFSAVSEPPPETVTAEPEQKPETASIAELAAFSPFTETEAPAEPVILPEAVIAPEAIFAEVEPAVAPPPPVEPGSIAAPWPEAAKPEPAAQPDDAGAFAEIPALFPSPAEAVSDGPEADLVLPDWLSAQPEPPPVSGPAGQPSRPLPPADEPAGELNLPPLETTPVSPVETEERDFPVPPSPAAPVHILPVTEVSAPREAESAKSGKPLPPEEEEEEPGFPGLVPLPLYTPPEEEPDPGPREEFLLVPDNQPELPPLDPVVTALNAPPVTFRPPAAPVPADSAQAKPEPEPEVETGMETSEDDVSIPLIIPTVVNPGDPVPPATTKPFAKEPPFAKPATAAPPEEIWKRAVAELASLRQGPPAPAPAFPLAASPPREGPQPPPPAFPGTGGDSPFTIAAKQEGAAESAIDPPPWMKAIPGIKPVTAEAFGPKPPSPDVFIPREPPDVFPPPPPAAALPSPPLHPAAPTPEPPKDPVPLFFKAAIPPARPASASAPVATTGPAVTLPPLPGFNPQPPPEAAVTPPADPPREEAPLLTILPPLELRPAPEPVAGAASPLFTPKKEPHPELQKYAAQRRAASEAPLPKKSLLTGGRLLFLLLLAAIAAGVVYRDQLIALWEERILGKSKKTSAPLSQPAPVPRGNPAGSPVTPPPAPAPDDRTPPDAAPRSAAPPEETTPAPAPPAPAATLPQEPDENPAPASPSPVAAATAAPPETGPLPVSEAGAKELIVRLLRATTPEAVTPYIYDADRLEPALKRYFTAGKVAPAASYECSHEVTGKTPAGRTMWLFRVITDQVPAGFPVGVEHTPDGLRTDWQLFAQCRDGALQAFLSDPAAPSGSFFTALQRAHTFPDLLPGEDHTSFLAFDIASPVMQAPVTRVFIKKGTPVAKKADQLFKWSMPFAPVLQLEHRKGRVEITGIPRENWRPGQLASNR